MKRDMDLCRRIMLAVENETGVEDAPERPVLAYHVALLQEAGLLDAIIQKDSKGNPANFHVKRLTWEGHEFLEASKDPTIWEKAKSSIIKPGASWTFGLLAEYLKAEAKKHLGLP